MAGQQFQYDDSGNTFFYFLTSFVGLIVIPATYYLWPRDQNAGAVQKTPRPFPPALRPTLGEGAEPPVLRTRRHGNAAILANRPGVWGCAAAASWAGQAGWTASSWRRWPPPW